MSKRRIKKSQKRSEPKRKSTISLVLGGAGAILLILFFALQSVVPTPKASGGTSGKGPSLSVDRQQVDLGDHKLGTSVKVSFQITNTGDTPLKFTEAPYIEVKEGC